MALHPVAGSVYATLRNNDRTDCVLDISQMLREGGRAVVFCSALKFKLWYDAFASCPDVISSDDDR